MGRRWRAVRGCPGLYRISPGGGLFVRFVMGGRGPGRDVGGRAGVCVSRKVPVGLSVREARAWVGELRERAGRQLTGQRTDGYGLGRLVGEYMDFVGLRLRASTLRAYGCNARVIVDWLGREGVRTVDGLTPQVVQRYVSGRVRGRIVYQRVGGVSNRTVNLEVDALRRVLRWGAGDEWGVLRSNPLAKFRRLPEGDGVGVRSFEAWEYGALLDHRHPVNGNVRGGCTQGCRCRDLWVMLGDTGLRAGELGGLTWGDVDWGGWVLRVRRGKTAASSRTVGMTCAVAEVLGRRLWRIGLGGRAGRGVIFAGGRGGALAGGLGGKLGRCLLAAGIDGKGLRVHSFRHWFASRLLGGGASPKAVQGLLGHATSKLVMEVYGHELEGDRARAIAGLDAAAAANRNGASTRFAAM